MTFSKYQMLDCGYTIYMQDTGAGVILFRDETGFCYLPGHALIDGKLVSGPMLEKDAEGVTMGDRLAGLENLLEKERLYHASTVTQARHKLGEMITELKAIVKAKDDQIAELMKQLADIKAANAQHSVSFTEEKNGWLGFKKKT